MEHVERKGENMMHRLTAALLALMMILLLLPGVNAEEQTENTTQRLSNEELYPFFDNCIFVGDSITRQLRVYVLEQQKKDPAFMKGTRFFTAQSYMLYIASRKYLQSDAVNLTLNGDESTMTNIIRQLKPRYVFILLGVNDYIGETIDKGIGYVERIIELAKEASPETVIVFQSLTPVTRAFCRKKDYRTMWDKYNVAMKAACEKNGAVYLEIAEVLKDEEGYLKESYSSDGKYHLGDDGLKLWVECLLDFAQSEADAGRWEPK